ncbi:uncharacterized protein BT62DRAFT_929388 [Guyanagaster necrorhizus]|uniref:Uncharacterized protein n=1 Tax=Guyanagaster necrorhizus TaxID=856835 RepID=A0A9P8AVK5_9AGAR|nr:uncharacterized protein BT62DRAFT_929388 [Guyanagaster necrorhizus MCA 3950]KAG7449420.1 hypothetical protein BT62DRAFT_929388 [Guyanagaster necrorhizus MCA 3950]
MAGRQSLEYAPSVSSFAPSTNVPSTADVSPRLDSVLTLSTATTSSTHQRRTRRSLSLLDKIPTEFSSLLRSHSTSRRYSAIFQSNQATKVRLSDYADSHPSTQRPTSKDMYASQDNERPSRKSKSGNRFYNFITRSRSRSRTKAEASVDIEPVLPDLSQDYVADLSTHSQQSSVSSRAQLEQRCHTPSSKSSALHPSRPLSSTTTATNTTIKPPTPKAKRRAAVPIPKPNILAQENENPSNAAGSRPGTPKLSTRKKLHSLFGIPLSGARRSGSRKSSISSTRPTTPDLQSSADAPPLPLQPEAPNYYIHANSHDPIPPHMPGAPLSLHMRPGDSNVNRTPVDPLESSTSTTASCKRDTFFKAPKLFSVRNPLVTSPTPSTFDDRPCPSSPPPPVVSFPIKHRRTQTQIDAQPSPTTPATPVQRATQPVAPQPRRATTLTSDNDVTIPRITHTPATPSRPGTSPPRLSQRKDSLDSTHLYRVMSVVDEEKERTESDPVSDKGKKRNDSVKPGHRSGVKNAKGSMVRSTRHGSFDFERPGMISRTASGNSVSTNMTGAYSYNRSGDSLSNASRSGEPSGLGSSRSGVAQKDIPLQPPKRRRSHRATPPIAPLEPDYTGASSSTNHSKSTTGTNGLSSSLGRNAGKRMLGSGVARLVSIPHGPFSFEPPVPSPTVSNMSESTRGSGMGDREAEEREREVVERRRQGDHELTAIKQSWRTAHVDIKSEPTPSTTVGYRSATKGRSLDLGLGLAWAPTKVREEALIPSSTFALSRSTSSRNGLKSAAAKFAEERSKVGKEIAEMFKNALGIEQYATFKQYVHRFDAHDIPFDGPTGIIARAGQLLDNSRNLGDDGKKHLLDNLVRVILQNA